MAGPADLSDVTFRIVDQSRYTEVIGSFTVRIVTVREAVMISPSLRNNENSYEIGELKRNFRYEVEQNR